MRVHVEGVRLEPCDIARALARGLAKLRENLFEASVRTPPSVSSRHLLEEGSRLALGLESLASELADTLCGETGRPPLK